MRLRSNFRRSAVLKSPAYVQGASQHSDPHDSDRHTHTHTHHSSQPASLHHSIRTLFHYGRSPFQNLKPQYNCFPTRSPKFPNSSQIHPKHPSLRPISKVRSCPSPFQDIAPPEDAGRLRALETCSSTGPLQMQGYFGTLLLSFLVGNSCGAKSSACYTAGLAVYRLRLNFAPAKSEKAPGAKPRSFTGRAKLPPSPLHTVTQSPKSPKPGTEPLACKPRTPNYTTGHL